MSRGHGFYGNGTPDEIAGDLAGLRRAADEVERPARLGPLEVTAMPLEPVDAAAVARYAELGVDRLVLRPEAERSTTPTTSPGSSSATPTLGGLTGAAGSQESHFHATALP